jgi:2-methylcitrate dehydratase PrpD
MKKKLTDLFIEEIFTLSKTNFDDHVVHCFKRCLVDYLGATIAGAKINKSKAKTYLELIESKSAETSLIGMNQRVDVSTATFINGLNSHIAELDDGVISGIIHPGAPIFSALLPIIEKKKVSISKLITAGIVGYEASVRLADSVQPSHKAIGYHASGTCGTIGATIAIAIALDFSKEEMKHAFSTAALSGYGTLKVLEDGSELKPFNIAKAANNGLIAAYNAKVGYKGPDDVLEGERGWLSLMSKEHNYKVLLKKTNNKYAIERTYFKPYAACRYTHPSIDAALNMRKTIKTELIESVNIFTYYWAVYKHDHIDIPGVSSAKMSIPFNFALAMVNGKANINEYTNENISKKAIIDLASKVKVITNDEYTKLFPQKSVAKVQVLLKNGDVISEIIDFAKGEPENPMNDNELSEKFSSLALFNGFTKEKIEKTLNYIWSINKDSSTPFEIWY